MKRATECEGDLGRCLEPIRALPFVTALDWTVRVLSSDSGKAMLADTPASVRHFI